MASATRFEELLSYLVVHAADLQRLRCQSLRELLRTGEARPGRAAIPERAAWYRYLQRQGHTFTDAQQEALRAREAVLRAPAGAERLAAQPALVQHFFRFLALLERRFEEFAALRKPSLKAIFDVSAASTDAEMTFGKNFINQSFPKLSQEQKDVLLEREATLCEPADAEHWAAQPALQRQLDRFVALLDRRFEDLAALRKVSLKAIFNVNAANSDTELKFGLNFMSR